MTGHAGGHVEGEAEIDRLMMRRPDARRVHDLLRRYEPVRLRAETAQLRPGDRRALGKLVEAARYIDPIYWRQRSRIGWALWQALQRSGERSGELGRLLRLNYGPWDNLDGDAPFWGDHPLPPGASFYPPELTRDQLDAYLAAHPDQRAALLGPTSLVEPDGDRLRAVPYDRAYQPELRAIASAMRAASEPATDAAFRRYLAARADGLCTGELQASERLWVDAASSPIDLVIGPHEVYDDALRGMKTSYEAAVLVRHALSERMTEFEGEARDLARDLPGAVADDPTEGKVRIGVYDMVFAAGMFNLGSKAIAVALPNDEHVRRDHGSRLLLFRNVIAAKFDAILAPLAAHVLAPAELDLVDRDAFLYQTLLHEAGHVIGSGFVQCGRRDSKTTIKDALGERYSTIEEARADLLGMRFLGALVARRTLPAELAETSAATFVVSSLRSVRFGDRSDHARAAAIALSQLHAAGAVRRDGDRLRIDPARTQRTLDALAERVQAIASAGDYDAAGRLIADHSTTPPAIAELLVRTTDVPVDLEFVFEAQPADDFLAAGTG